ncbi:DUF499 domain-containing protein [Azospirillum argentinense]|uniref:DUF499 domain-containing protein n=1 Tax=Azospirillum argentinense TaxID=2970906 RepID=A0ABW8V865_9PROT
MSATKPWHQLVKLRPEFLSGELTLADFAADLYDVLMNRGRPIYSDPALFFAMTFPTYSLRELAREVAERLRGKSTKAIRQLELTYGGGKTHTMVTLTHLVRNPAELPSNTTVQEFESTMGGKAPQARVAALCFDKLDLEKGVETLAPDGEVRFLKQPWSVLAFQLAGADGLRFLHGEGKDEERQSPPRDAALIQVLSAPAKQGMATLLLMDEVLMYVREKVFRDPPYLEEFKNFLQSLTQSITKVDTCAMVVSLLASDPTKDDELGRRIVLELSNILGRMEDTKFLPVEKGDIAEVLRRRLFDPGSVTDREAFRPQVAAVVKAIASLDPGFAKEQKAKEAAFFESFPFHPDVTEVLYTKWTNGLPLFQRTRGVLRTFAVALRDATVWDTAPVAGPSILLSPPQKDGLSDALRGLASVARVEQTEGPTQNWVVILERELSFARQSQERNASLQQHREVEQAVVATFLHSQPPGQIAKTPELLSLVGTGKPDRIIMEKGLEDWAGRTWYLDEHHLESGELKPDGTRGLPKTWRIGNQPNLKQMHDDARVNRVSASSVEERLLAEIKGTKALTQGASALVKVHTLPTGPSEVIHDGEFRYAVLGPSAASESGAPSAEARRYIDETSSKDAPRAKNRNAVVLAVPSRSALDVARERVRDHLGWLEVKKILTESGQELEPVKAAKLKALLESSETELKRAVRQAYCIVVTAAADNTVQAFKLTVDESKALFATIKEDVRSRIKETALDANTLLPGGPYKLWLEDEGSRWVKDLVGAFFEQAALPKMLRRRELLDTVANGAEQGLFVLSLKRPDGTRRTWWRTRVDENAIQDSELEAFQIAAAELVSVDPALLRPDALVGLDWSSGLKVSELCNYFSGTHTVQIQHLDPEWTEEVSIPRCPEDAVLAAVTSAVTSGSVWLVNGTASEWGETPAAGVVTKSAVLHPPPQPIPVTELTPEALPDAWNGSTATAFSIHQALSAKLGGTPLPWKLVSTAVSAALSYNYLRLVPGTVTWPCQPHEATAVEFRLPAADDKPPPKPPKNEPDPEPLIIEASLDAGQVQELADNLGAILSAADGLTVRFRVAVEFGDGEVPSPEVQAAVVKVFEESVGLTPAG